MHTRYAVITLTRSARMPNFGQQSDFYGDFGDMSCFDVHVQLPADT